LTSQKKAHVQQCDTWAIIPGEKSGGRIFLSGELWFGVLKRYYDSSNCCAMFGCGFGFGSGSGAEPSSLSYALRSFAPD
jgi:hypothetical protein